MSIVFRSSILRQLNGVLNIEDLSKAIAVTKNDIKSLFDPETSYEEVDKAVQLILDTGSTLEDPLQMVVEFCEVTNFSVAQEDQGFERLA